jgi:hypothetical protein
MANRLKLIMRIELAVIIFIFLFFGFIFGLNCILNFNLNTVSNEKESSSGKVQYEKIDKYDNNFKKINLQVSQAEKIEKDQLYWSNVFFHFSQVILPGISIQNLATKDYTTFLMGKADSRDNLIAFKDKLEKDGCFSDINLPLSNLVSKGDIDFQMDLKIKEDCIKTK